MFGLSVNYIHSEIPISSVNMPHCNYTVTGIWIVPMQSLLRTTGSAVTGLPMAMYIVTALLAVNNGDYTVTVQSPFSHSER